MKNNFKGIGNFFYGIDKICFYSLILNVVFYKINMIEINLFLYNITYYMFLGIAWILFPIMLYSWLFVILNKNILNDIVNVILLDNIDFKNYENDILFGLIQYIIMAIGCYILGLFFLMTIILFNALAYSKVNYDILDNLKESK